MRASTRPSSKAARGPGGFDDDVDALAVRERPHVLEPLLRRRAGQVVDAIRAHRAGEIEPRRRRANRDDRRRAGKPCQRNRAQADRAGALDDDALAGSESRRAR